ncbi:helix-turn-helix domain-containing protein [Agromyces indicus]|uniref:helix-turn-helix domain-containing protein n=1 Tax=Agromyces indicus TaxID=758919 RepID=UPI0035B666D3
MTDARNGFARIPDWLYREAVPALALTPREVAVFVVLVGRADTDGVCWPSQDLIAHEAGMRSRRSVRDALDVLARVGLITVTKGVGRQGTRYRVMPKPSLPDVPPFVIEPRRNGSHSTPFQAVESSEEWGPEDPSGSEEWVRKDPWNGVSKTPEVDTKSRPNEVDTISPRPAPRGTPQGAEADDVNADGQARLSALLPALSVPDEQRRQPPAPTSRARASTAHGHTFDPVSGYCGCGHRNDREEAS